MLRKIAVTLKPAMVADQSAADLLAEREDTTRLARELGKLDVVEERGLAEEGLGDESWPTY